jgi:type I restriction enzyme S subunit
MYPLRANDNSLDSKFLYFWILSEQFTKQAVSHQSRTGIPKINRTQLESTSMPLPPYPEQRAIAHVLRAVQRAKEATEKVSAATRQLKASLMRYLFTYGPVPVDDADRVPLRDTDFGKVPNAWRISPLDESSEVQTGVTKGRRLNGADVVSVPYLRVANVQDGYLDLAEMKNIDIRRSEVARYSLQLGDVVLTEGGDFDKLGRGFIWNGEVPGCVHQNHIFAVRAKRSEILPGFLAYLTQSPYGKAYFLSVAHKTTNLACINTTKLKAFPALSPSIQEQQVIVDALCAVDGKIAVEEAKRRAIDSLFKTLLHHLMTGKLRVRDLDPTDHSHSGTAAG